MFSKKLKQAMQDSGMTLTALSKATGIGKSSISQYLHGKNEPAEPRKAAIAEALHLDRNYFNEPTEVNPTDDIVIPKLLPFDVARMMGISNDTVYKGLQDGIFPWGYAIQTSPNRWTYFINAKKFFEIERVEI